MIYLVSLTRQYEVTSSNQLILSESERVTQDLHAYCLFLRLSLQIRTMMIDGETGERTIHTLVKTQDEVRGNAGRGFTCYTRGCWGTLKLDALVEAEMFSDIVQLTNWG